MKKVLSIILSFVLTLSIVTNFSISASAQGEWDSYSRQYLKTTAGYLYDDSLDVLLAAMNVDVCYGGFADSMAQSYFYSAKSLLGGIVSRLNNLKSYINNNYDLKFTDIDGKVYYLRETYDDVYSYTNRVNAYTYASLSSSTARDNYYDLSMELNFSCMLFKDVAEKGVVDYTSSNSGTQDSHTHYYSNSCDTTCNECGATRSVIHNYSNSCDSTCNVCGEIRSISHIYDNVVDVDCNICAYERAITTEPVLVKQTNGKWYYYVNGNRSNVTKFVNHSGTWYYLQNGEWKSNTIIAKYNGKFYYAKDGKINKSISGSVKYKGKYYLIKNGVWQKNANGIKKVNGTQYYVKKGILQTKVKGIKKAGKMSYYFKKGIVQSAFTGIIKSSKNRYYVKSGKVQKNYTGLMSYQRKWYYVRKGLVDSNANGTATRNGVKFEVRKGIARAEKYHDCYYEDATCTKPQICIYCFDTRGRVEDHEFVNSNCVKCNKYIKIPFTVEFSETMQYHDVEFTIDQYNIRQIDDFYKGYSKIYFTTTNVTGGTAFFRIYFYDSYGSVLKTSTQSCSRNEGQIEVDYTYIPEGTKRIVFARAD